MSDAPMKLEKSHAVERELLHALFVSFQREARIDGCELTNEECMDLAKIAIGPVLQFAKWADALMEIEVEKAAVQIVPKWRQLGPEHDVINIPAQSTRAFVK
jgi:hypothetical protein